MLALNVKQLYRQAQAHGQKVRRGADVWAQAQASTADAEQTIERMQTALTAAARGEFLRSVTNSFAGVAVAVTTGGRPLARERGNFYM